MKVELEYQMKFMGEYLSGILFKESVDGPVDESRFNVIVSEKEHMLDDFIAKLKAVLPANLIPSLDYDYAASDMPTQGKNMACSILLFLFCFLPYLL